MPYTIAIDLDGTIFDWAKDEAYSVHKFGPLIDGAKKFMEDAYNAGNFIVIHTCRTSPSINQGVDSRVLKMIVAAELDRNNLPYHEIWSGKGKPIADVYIDDRAVRFDNWKNVRDFLDRE